MTAGPAETMLQAVACPKNALTRTSPHRFLKHPLFHHVPARQRAFCPSRRLRHASGSPDAGDDPVNEGDPSGLATIGVCVTAQVSVFKSWGGSGCVERLVNSSGGLGGHIAATASHASALGVGFGASVGTYYDVSSASSLSELGGEFSFTEVELDIVAGGFAVVYWNSQFAGATRLDRVSVRRRARRCAWGRGCRSVWALVHFGVATRMAGYPPVVGHMVSVSA